MILVLNVGSTSIRYALFDNEKVKLTSQKIENPKNFGIAKIIKLLTDGRFISSVNELDLIVHRVVFGGQNYTATTELTAGMIQDLEKISDIAPLHNPPALRLIKEIIDLYPQIVQKAVFDTSFHHTLEPKTYLYALPYKYYEQYGIRKYGFHGISHSSVAKKVANLTGSTKSRLISVHLGGGCSVCAIKDGKSVDVSMGFSPEEGLIMTTRSGTIGDGALLYLEKKLHKNSDEMVDLLNHGSGLLGISGISGDMRELLASKNPRAQLAIDMYCLSIAKTIGSFIPQIRGIDTLIFTGGVGEKSVEIRQKVCDYLTYIGVELDSVTNNQMENGNQCISSLKSKVQVWVLPADEESEIISQI